MGRTKNKDAIKTKPKAKQRSERYQRYQKYIRSKKFKEVKRIVNERDGGMCQFCGRTRADGVQLSVHHRSYKHLFQGGQAEADDCILICSREHRLLHSMKFNLKWFSMDNEHNNVKEEEEDEPVL